MKTSACTTLLFLLTATIATAQINFPDGTSLSSGGLTNVVTVQASGTGTENGTRLLAAMSAIASNNTTPIVVQLGGGTFNLGASALQMQPNVTLRGVSRFSSIVTGTGTVLVEANNNSFLSDLTLQSSASGNTLLRAQFANQIDCLSVSFQSTQSGGGTGTSIQVLSGAEVGLIGCDLSGDSNNPGGSRTAISVSGANSNAFLDSTLLDMIEESQTGALTGIATSSGGIVEASGGEFLVDRDTTAASGNSVTTISVGSGSRVNLRNTSCIAHVNTSSGFSLGTAVSNAGGFTAFAVLFQGTIPNPATQFTTSELSLLRYSQCSQDFLDIASL